MIYQSSYLYGVKLILYSLVVHLYLARFKAWLQGSKVVKGPQADVDAIAAE